MNVTIITTESDFPELSKITFVGLVKWRDLPYIKVDAGEEIKMIKVDNGFGVYLTNLLIRELELGIKPKFTADGGYSAYGVMLMECANILRKRHNLPEPTLLDWFVSSK